jgi:hypothetical protein
MKRSRESVPDLPKPLGNPYVQKEGSSQTAFAHNKRRTDQFNAKLADLPIGNKRNARAFELMQKELV